MPFLFLGGKPITPTGEQLLVNGSHMNGSHEANGTTVVDSATKLEVKYFQISASCRHAFTKSILNIVQKIILGVAASQSVKRYKITTEKCRKRRSCKRATAASLESNRSRPTVC